MRKRTIVWSVVLLLVAGILASILPLVSGATRREVVFSTSWSLRETGETQRSPPQEGPPRDEPRRSSCVGRGPETSRSPIYRSTPERVRKAIAHVLGESGVGWAVLKFLLWATCVPVVLLTILTRHVIRTVRIVWLVGVVVVFGVALGASPNPMEALVKDRQGAQPHGSRTVGGRGGPRYFHGAVPGRT